MRDWTSNLKKKNRYQWLLSNVRVGTCKQFADVTKYIVCSYKHDLIKELKK